MCIRDRSNPWAKKNLSGSGTQQDALDSALKQLDQEDINDAVPQTVDQQDGAPPAPDLAGMMQAMGPMLSGLSGKGRGSSRNAPDLAGMMQAMGPMLSGLSGKGRGSSRGNAPDLAGMMQTMMGGKGRGRGSGRAPRRGAVPALSEEERDALEQVLMRDDERQAAMQEQRPLSDAYISGRKGYKKEHQASVSAVSDPRSLLGRMLSGAAGQAGVDTCPAAQAAAQSLSDDYLCVIARSMVDQALGDPDYMAGKNLDLDRLIQAFS
eukprot:TRINITY_DN6166_c0_g1_i3.p1 TRINITY_DN6166_c0_g1~~TRINITY_DN6166_c0_g1_i3.p1  ORF type:complete len:265 (+),score=47.27 TRINITY_DN6166_c0_g1_i3:129-923(+)